MKFSVLLPTRNRLDLLSYAIETVRRQDYENWEIIVSDNFSEENIAEYVLSLNEPRIKYFRTESFIPVTDNWNNALEKSDGDYVVMLGDDDGLLNGYFSEMKSLIDSFDKPSAIYTNALLFAYPGVLAEQPNGFLKSYKNRRLFKGYSMPYLLGDEQRHHLLEKSLNFQMDYDYNMQFFLVSKKLIKELSNHGPFYQSPYPDYYASNVLLLKAKNILVTPHEMISIGISPKSFGYYYFNDSEVDGDKFLNNSPDKNLVKKLKPILLPGTEMNTNWLLSLETMLQNYSDQSMSKVNYYRYRHIQISAVLIKLLLNKKNAVIQKRELIAKLDILEMLRYGLLLIIIPTLIPKRFIPEVLQYIIRMQKSHPEIYMPDIKGQFRDMLEVFNEIRIHH